VKAIGYHPATGNLLVVDSTDPPENGEKEHARVRYVLLNSHAGTGLVLKEHKKTKKDDDTQLSLAARDDGSFVIASSRKGHDVVVRKAVLKKNGKALELRGCVHLKGTLLDQIFNTTSGVVVPILRADGFQVLSMVTADQLGDECDGDDEP
jgi:hypothetical protein